MDEAQTVTILTLEDVQKLTSQERIGMISELRNKNLASGLEDHEKQLGIRLIRAERVVRAGAQGGSKDRQAAAQKTFELTDF